MIEYIKCALCGKRIRANGWHVCIRDGSFFGVSAP